MDMKVERTSISPINGIQAVNRANFNVPKNSKQDADSLAVSDKGQFYQVLIQKVKDLPEVREEKVQELSNQIERGEFQINASLIAQSLLNIR